MLRETLLKDIPEIKIHGRITKNHSPLTIFWTAGGFECNVTGTELWVELEVSYDTYEPWFSYTINGDWIGRQMLVRGRYWVPLFRGMNDTCVKNVHFYKDLQAMSDDGNSFIQIHALRHDGEFLPVEEKRLKLEFIGDSITSGEGLFGARQEADWIPMFFSALRDYAYLTARKLDADYRVFSQSGWGVHCAWDNNPNGAIPKYYREVCGLVKGEQNERLGGRMPHDFGSWQPDFVIVNLGTNDANAFEQPAWVDPETGETYKMRKNMDGTYMEEDAEAFCRDVIAFLRVLRECNPDSRVIWCGGMLGVGLRDYIISAVEEYRAQTGDEKVSYLQLPEVTEETLGSRGHPGVLCHEQAAEVLAEYIGRCGR